MVDVDEALAEVWAGAGGRPEALASVEVVAARAILPSTFAIETAAAATTGAAALAAADLHRARGGGTQRVVVDVRHAVAACRSERLLRVDGEALPLWDPLAGFYPTADGWVQLHTNFAHHREAAVGVLGGSEEREAAARALRSRQAAEVEEAIVGAGGCAAMLRSPQEWGAHPQASAVAATPLVATIPRRDGAPEPLPAADRPLGGVRVLDLTRVIAGPVCGRVLASHGADVLRVSAPHLPDVEAAVIDGGFGKRSTHLDLRAPADAVRFHELVAGADVVVQSYRPGALAALGAGPAALAARRPGLVVVELSAYGPAGPWAARRGYDSLVQTVSGIAESEGAARGGPVPVHLPAQILDHATGHLAALGAMRALADRAEVGGGALVRVSLARTAAWVWSLGRPDTLGVVEPVAADVDDLLATTATPWGPVTHVVPVGGLDRAPPRYDRPPPRPGADPPVWLPRSP